MQKPQQEMENGATNTTTLPNPKRRTRKPLLDCTNSLTSSSSTKNSSSVSLIKKTINKPTPLPPPLPPPPQSILSSAPKILAPKRSKSGSTTNTAKNDTVLSNSSTLLPPVPSTPSRPPQSSSLAGIAGSDEIHEIVEPCSVYSRRPSAAKRKIKGKEIAAPMSYTPAMMTEFTRDRVVERGVTGSLKTCPVPSKKKQRWTAPEVKNHALPQDFIDQQRAYFAEIDAFQLPVEEVKSSEELD